LGEIGTSAPGISGRRTAGGRKPVRKTGTATAWATIATGICALALGACGGGGERQDADEPRGEFPVEVVTSKFPNRQRLAGRTDLVLGVENTGEETVPNLAVTIFVDGGTAGPFSIRLDDPALANPNRPVWILEDKYPRIKGFPLAKGSSPGTTAQTNTFGFGELPPGERIEMIWRVTPVKAGTYTVNYEISAGLQGEAKAVTADGTPPEGKFVVTITDKPPRARVNDAGKVEIIE
jgi:hypothetical protein